MPEYTEEQVEEMVRKAVEKTEKSFGGTFRRLKSENEELKARCEAAAAERDAAREELERRIGELEALLEAGSRRISELAVRGEVQRQLREAGPLPERFIDVDSIEYSDDPEVLRENVARAVEKGREEFGKVLAELGITARHVPGPPPNPTNPPSRDTGTARNVRRAEARDVLADMARRGLLR